MSATLEAVEGLGRGGRKVECRACLGWFYARGNRTLCPDCVEQAIILSELLGVTEKYAREILPGYVLEAARRDLVENERGVDPDSDPFGTKANARYMNEAIRKRLVREGRLPTERARPRAVKDD